MEEERVINLKGGGAIPKIREGHEVLKADSILMKWNTFGGEASAPSKSYMPMISSDDSKEGHPNVAPKMTVDDTDDTDESPKALPDTKVAVSEADSDSASDSGSDSDSESESESKEHESSDSEEDEPITPKDVESDKKQEETEKATQKIFKSDQEIAKEGDGSDEKDAPDSDTASSDGESEPDVKDEVKDEVKNLVKKDDDDQAGGGMRVKELTSLDLSDNVLFATLTNIFVSTKNENNIADIMENIAFDLREMRLMMAVEHKARRK